MCVCGCGCVCVSVFGCVCVCVWVCVCVFVLKLGYFITLYRFGVHLILPLIHLRALSAIKAHGVEDRWGYTVSEPTGFLTCGTALWGGELSRRRFAIVGICSAACSCTTDVFIAFRLSTRDMLALEFHSV